MRVYSTFSDQTRRLSSLTLQKVVVKPGLLPESSPDMSWSIKIRHLLGVFMNVKRGGHWSVRIRLRKQQIVIFHSDTYHSDVMIWTNQPGAQENTIDKRPVCPKDFAGVPLSSLVHLAVTGWIQKWERSPNLEEANPHKHSSCRQLGFPISGRHPDQSYIMHCWNPPVWNNSLA